MIPTKRAPTRPGEVLLEEFLKPKGISQVELARKIGIPLQRVNTLIKGKRACTAETALLLSKEFGNSPEFWMNLQSACDLFEAKIRLKAGLRVAQFLSFAICSVLSCFAFERLS